MWDESNRIRTGIRNAASIYGLAGNGLTPFYVYGTIVQGDRLLHVSLFTTFLQTAGTTGIRNRPIVHLEILEVKDFNPTLVVLQADEIATQISAKGSVALYGIQFEIDSDVITPSSADAVLEVAKALQADTALNVLVVGHTDNTGTLLHNRDLSSRRAMAVVDRLVSAHGLSPERLTAVGVGPVAPLAGNDTDEGRALNRRVQIVQR